MKTLESKGIVRRVVEEDGEFLVSFPGHDGYFNVPDAVLKQKILEAQEQKKEIAFTYDRELTILEIR